MSIANKEQKPNFGEHEGIWEYFTLDGIFIGYVVRKPPTDDRSRKWFLPFTFQDNKWVPRWSEVYKAPFYNGQLLSLYPERSILLVEGEKTCDAATKLFPEFLCLTWKGGAGSIKQVPVEQLKGRKIAFWPDNDLAGYKAMNALYSRFIGIARCMSMVNTKNLFVSEGWDLADYTDDNDMVDLNLILQIIRDDWETYDSTIKNPLERCDFPDLSSKGNPLNTSSNVNHLLAHHQLLPNYNLMTHYPEFPSDTRTYSKVNESDCFFTEIGNLCVINGIPKVDLAEHLLFIADKQRYHPAINFIESKPWDGISRLEDLYNTIVSDNPPNTNRLLYRWLIGSVAAAYSENGIALEGILVFQGKQKIGKTHWFIKLVPEAYQHLIRTPLALDPNNKDSVMDCTSCWLGELAELDGIINRSQSSAQKQFLTRSSDVYRIPWGKRLRSVPRRTSYFGSVNPETFLADPTGNRRYWVIHTTKIDHNHSIDMQQLWAEVKVLFDQGESFKLSNEEQDSINEGNEAHTIHCPIEEAIVKKFRWDDLYRNYPMTVSDVLQEIGYGLVEIKLGKLYGPTGTALSKLTGTKSRKTNGIWVYDMPSIIVHKNL